MARLGMGAGALMLTLVACGGEAAPSADLADRRAQVAEAGAAVMPFDLDATTHVFEKLDDGGLQQVYADTDDAAEVTRIREHVQREAERFARGDFHDPAAVHGHDMPGLHALATGHDRVDITWGEIPRGAEIRYRTADPALVTAIHDWFDAQLRDHGEHAQGHR